MGQPVGVGRGLSHRLDGHALCGQRGGDLRQHARPVDDVQAHLGDWAASSGQAGFTDGAARHLTTTVLDGLRAHVPADWSVTHERGADILTVRHRGTGIDVLFSTPWRDHADDMEKYARGLFMGRE